MAVRRPAGRVAGLVLLLVALVMGAAGPALARPGAAPAADYPPSACANGVSLTTTIVRQGAQVTIRSCGFRGGTRVTLELHSEVVRLAALTADRSGAVRGTVRIPTCTMPGGHQIVLIGTAPSGATLIRRASITVRPSSACASATPTRNLAYVQPAEVDRGITGAPPASRPFALPFTGAPLGWLLALALLLVALGALARVTGRRRRRSA